jgi:hypothetical protein
LKKQYFGGCTSFDLAGDGSALWIGCGGWIIQSAAWVYFSVFAVVALVFIPCLFLGLLLGSNAGDQI